MEFSWKEFKNYEFGVHCKTEEEAKEFLKMANENGIEWRLSSKFCTHWDIYEKDTYYVCEYNNLMYGCINTNIWKLPIIEFSKFKACNKRKFDWEEFKSGKVRVHCNTKEKSDEFIKMCYSNNIRWGNNNNDDTNKYWLNYKESTYYGCYSGYLVFGNILLTTTLLNYEATYEFEDVINFEEDNKMELKEGMIIECRNGEKFLLRIIHNDLIASNEEDWFGLKYDKNFIDELFPDFDIMKIYKSDTNILRKLFDDNCLTCIWERKEPKKMTLEEISEALGYEVEVIDND